MKNPEQAGTSHDVRTDLFAGLSGRYAAGPAGNAGSDKPLIVAIHGGTYTSAYFDISGYSLLDVGEALEVPVLAIDRPGYGSSALLPGTASSIENQARFLLNALGEAWKTYGGSTRGIVLIGHSIGGAIATTMAARCEGEVPIIGLAISGVGLRVPDHFPGMWASLPETPRIELPLPLKDEVMFGPAGSYRSPMPQGSHLADAPAPRQEILDIVTTWIENVAEVLGRVRVPVHYRQGEFDHLWIVDETEVKRFGEALKASPSVDAALVKGTGHCMDLHCIAEALHAQQVGFALQCAVQCVGSSAG